MAANKSTTGPIAIFKLLGWLAPPLGEALALRLFATPPRARDLNRSVAVRCEPFTLDVAGRRLRAFRVGEGPRVALFHGWGGHAGDFDAWLEPLLAAGFSVVSVDAPAHGASPGRRSSLPEFTATLQALADHTPLHAVVAHSFGCAALVLALKRGLALERAVLIAPVVNPRLQLERFARHLGLRELSMAQRGERYFGITFAEVDAELSARTLSLPAFIVHDDCDRIIDVAESRALSKAWSNSVLQVTTGLGHKRGILQSPDIISKVIDWLGERVDPT